MSIQYGRYQRLCIEAARELLSPGNQVNPRPCEKDNRNEVLEILATLASTLLQSPSYHCKLSQYFR